MTDALATTAPAVDPAVSIAQKRTLAEKTLKELLVHLDVPATLEWKDLPEGGISAAVKLEVELPGVQAGKRSHFVEALQFLVNKVVNKPGTPRHWVAVGIGAHPEPRGPKPARPNGAPVAAPVPTTASPAAPSASPQGQVASRPAPKPAPAPAARDFERDERNLDVPPDAALRSAAKTLAGKSAQHGRFYALVGMKSDERAQVLLGTDGVEGVRVSAEGEGRNRRVVFTPAKPAPMPKRTLPADDDEDDLD